MQDNKNNEIAVAMPKEIADVSPIDNSLLEKVELMLTLPEEQGRKLATENKFNKTPMFNKHTALIHNDMRVTTVNALKCLNIICKICETDNFTRGSYVVSKKTFWKSLGYNRFNHANTYAALHLLRNTIHLKFNKFNRDKKNATQWQELSVGETSFISSFFISPNKDYIYFEMPELIRKLLTYPNMYARININDLKELTTLFEIYLYEHYISEMVGECEMITEWQTLTFLRQLLMSEEKYTEDKEFIRKIKKTIEKITQVTTLAIKINDVKYAANGKKIEAYKFHLKRQPKVQNGDEITVSATSDKITLLSTDHSSIEIIPREEYSDDIGIRLSRHFSNAMVKKIFKTLKEKYPNHKKHLNDYIKANMDYALEQHYEEKKDNFKGFLYSAIKNDYANYFGKLFVKEEQEAIDALKRECQQGNLFDAVEHRQIDDGKQETRRQIEERDRAIEETRRKIEEERRQKEERRKNRPKSLIERLYEKYGIKDTILFESKRMTLNRLPEATRAEVYNKTVLRFPQIYVGNVLGDDCFLRYENKTAEQESDYNFDLSMEMQFQTALHFVTDDLKLADDFIESPTL